MRKCCKCKINKESSEFYKNKSKMGGISYDCRQCRKQYSDENKSKRAEYFKKNADRFAARRKLYNARPEVKERMRAYTLKRDFNITVADYEKMFVEQGGRCAICGIHQDLQKRRMAVDHSHVSLKIRGLLCGLCNRRICGMIDVRAKSKNVKLSELDFVEKLYAYYKKAS